MIQCHLSLSYAISKSCNKYINYLFLSAYFVFADLFADFIKIAVYTTGHTDGVDISAWYYWGDDDSAIAGVHFTDV